MSKVKYWQCEDCGFVVNPLEVKCSKFKILECRPRCKAYPQPFKQIMEEELPFKSITDNNTSTTIDIGTVIREEIQKNYDRVLEQIEYGTWEKLSIGHLKALRDACSKELAKRGVRGDVGKD